MPFAAKILDETVAFLERNVVLPKFSDKTPNYAERKIEIIPNMIYLLICTLYFGANRRKIVYLRIKDIFR